MMKKISLSLIALLIVICILTSACLITSAAAIPFSRSTVTAEQLTPSPTQTVSQQMDEIQNQVLSFRGLSLNNTVTRALMTPDELKEKVVNDFFADYSETDAKSDAEVLSALGLLEPNFDLLKFYQDLYSEQIAGYYDNKTKEMYVITGEAFAGTERMTYAHEFTHILQDQNYDMENGLKVNDENCKIDTEYCAAVSALIEGDATLSEYYWFMKYSTDLDKQQLNEFQQSYTSPVYDSAPTYMKEDFLFPYTQGYEFANYLYLKNKWESINAAYLDPPVTTEQILHPEKYPDDKPVTVPIPDLLPILGNGWEEVERNVMGEWYTYLILADGRDPVFQLPQQDAKDASTGWGGDTYVYYDVPETSEFILVWVSQWDTPADGDEFYQSSVNYGNARWGSALSSTANDISWQSSEDGLVYMSHSGDRITWLMTPDLQAQRSIIAGLAGQE